MNESIQKTLLALKDVHGTQGSFVLNSEGVLLAMEMPALFDAAVFVEVGPRIERLAEGFGALGDELESCQVRFADHLLYIKWFAKGGVLCILTEANVNVPALKMAMNLAHKRIAAEIDKAVPMGTNGHAVAAPPKEPEAATATPAAAAAPPPVHPAPAPEQIIVQPFRRSQRMYRGQIVED